MTIYQIHVRHLTAMGWWYKKKGPFFRTFMTFCLPSFLSLTHIHRPWLLALWPSLLSCIHGWAGLLICRQHARLSVGCGEVKEITISFNYPGPGHSLIFWLTSGCDGGWDAGLLHKRPHRDHIHFCILITTCKLTPSPFKTHNNCYAKEDKSNCARPPARGTMFYQV